jgi:YbgC/YbaW family acyl-CoA thioester hydrolase
MIDSHTKTFRIRSYECDIYGHVNNAVYLRYLQEANLAFSNAAGWPLKRYESFGLNWWPSRINFEYLVPLYYGDTVNVTVQPTGIEATAFQQTFEFHKLGTSELVAKASTLSTLRYTTGNSTTPIPDEIRTAFFPNGQSSPPLVSPPFVTVPSPPPGTFRMHQRVDLRDVNKNKELDPATLLVYAGECGRQVINAHGWPMERMFEEGFAILLKSNKVEYFQPAYLDDELELATWVSNVRRISALRHYTIQRVRDGTRLACIHALGVWINLSTGLPRRPPEKFLSDFAPNISLGDHPIGQK